MWEKEKAKRVQQFLVSNDLKIINLRSQLPTKKNCIVLEKLSSPLKTISSGTWGLPLEDLVLFDGKRLFSHKLTDCIRIEKVMNRKM